MQGVPCTPQLRRCGGSLRKNFGWRREKAAKKGCQKARGRKRCVLISSRFAPLKIKSRKGRKNKERYILLRVIMNKMAGKSVSLQWRYRTRSKSLKEKGASSHRYQICSVCACPSLDRELLQARAMFSHLFIFTHLCLVQVQVAMQSKTVELMDEWMND